MHIKASSAHGVSLMCVLYLYMHVGQMQTLVGLCHGMDFELGEVQIELTPSWLQDSGGIAVLLMSPV